MWPSIQNQPPVKNRYSAASNQLPNAFFLSFFFFLNAQPVLPETGRPGHAGSI